jgi:hypothetical protein
MRKITLILATLGVITFAPVPAEAMRQGQAQGEVGAAEPGSELTIFHVVMGQGDYIWERFGHNALWIRDSSTGSSIAWNWGIFDFDQHDFIPRLARGQMLYMMAGYEALPMIQAYVGDDRSIVVQELNLTPAQRLRVRALAEEHARPENREYLYDYYRDNCSTRIRDLLDAALGGRIRALTDTVMTETTYRWHTQRLLQESFPAYAGAMLALGVPADREITAWEEMFLPVRMGEHLRSIDIPGESGEMVPLIAREETMFVAQRAPEPAEPQRPLLTFAFIGILVAAILAALGYAAMRSRGGLIAFAIGGALWSLLSGFLGLALLLLWSATDHVFMYQNLNVLQFNALSLFLVILLPATLMLQRAGGATRNLAFAIVALSLLGLLLKAVPGMNQVNAEIILLALPGHLALAWAVDALRVVGVDAVRTS